MYRGSDKCALRAFDWRKINYSWAPFVGPWCWHKNRDYCNKALDSLPSDKRAPPFTPCENKKNQEQTKDLGGMRVSLIIGFCTALASAIVGYHFVVGQRKQQALAAKRKEQHERLRGFFGERKLKHAERAERNNLSDSERRAKIMSRIDKMASRDA